MVNVFTMEDGIILTRAEAAKALRLDRSTVYRLENQGLIKSIKRGPKASGFTAGNLKAYLRNLNGGAVAGVDDAL